MNQLNDEHSKKLDQITVLLQEISAKSSNNAITGVHQHIDASARLAEALTTMTILQTNKSEAKKFSGTFPTFKKQVYQYIIDLREYIAINRTQVPIHKFYMATENAPKWFMIDFMNKTPDKKDQTVERYEDHRLNFLNYQMLELKC